MFRSLFNTVLAYLVPEFNCMNYPDITECVSGYTQAVETGVDADRGSLLNSRK
jgi:hypothetical protein